MVRTRFIEGLRRTYRAIPLPGWVRRGLRSMLVRILMTPHVTHGSLGVAAISTPGLVQGDTATSNSNSSVELVFDGRKSISSPGMLHFRCNICGNENLAHVVALKREEPSCIICGSTVRMRGMVHSLSVALFAKSLAIPDFPVRKDIVGMGMSDWEGYAKPLANKLSYTNTYYHQTPRLDITNIGKEDEASVDFLLSTDVYEHISPPVSIAFMNARRMLKPGGAFVFSVPYLLEGETKEHFPILHDYQIENRRGTRVLVNRTVDGDVEEFTNLVFHEGEGETLEFRVFSEPGLMRELENAGFMDITIMREPCFEHGIYWPHPGSLPLIARLRPQGIQIVDWGPKSGKVGSPANEQPDGSSAIWIRLDRPVDTVRVSLWIGCMRIDTVRVSQSLMTALIPEEVMRRPGSYSINLQCDEGVIMYPGDLCIDA